MFSEWMFTLLGLAICVLLYWYKSANRDTLWVRSSDISSLHLSGPEHIDQLTREKDQPKKVKPARQPWEYFLVLDVEATCVAGTDFNWPNEIIVRTPPSSSCGIVDQRSAGMACCSSNLGRQRPGN